MGVFGELVAGQGLPEQFFGAGVLCAIAVYLVIRLAAAGARHLQGEGRARWRSGSR